MKKRKFSFGGVHPRGNKYTENQKSVIMTNPKTLLISLSQHTGKPAKPQKNKGDTVSQGELIGLADGAISANIHASLSGKVSMIEIAPPPLGRNAEAMLIQVDENAKETEYKENKNFENLSTEEILNKIEAAGIVGMGGAMFPTSVKLKGSIDKRVDTFIINGAECEPYITTDHRMMLEYTEEIFIAINIVKKIIPSISKIIVGIEDNKKEPIEMMNKYAQSYGVEVIPLKTQYPQGGEKQIIEATTSRVVPAGKLPFDIGVLVHNIATLYAIYEAVVKDKPLINRLVTVAGDLIKEPKNIWIPIGSKFTDIINFCGGIDENEEITVIAGGPMMGLALPSLEQSTMKGTNSILVLKSASKIIQKEYPCISCARCVDVCPIKLMPTSIARAAKSKDSKKMLMLEIHNCFECGACAYVCPSRIPLVQWIRVGKGELRKTKG